MPKMKTHSGASKRFKMTGSGKIKRKRANGRHCLTTSKTRKQKNRLMTTTYVDGTQATTIKRLLGH